MKNKGFVITSIILALVAVLSIVMFFVVNVGMTGYTNVAKKFDKAMNEGDYEEAYEYLDVEDSVFLTKAAFLERNSVEADFVNSLDIKSAIKTVGKKGVGILISRIADIQYKVVESNVTGDNAQVTFQKTSKYDNYGIASSLATVTLKKSSHNHMGIFPNWKVNDESVIVENITLHIPKCDKAYIDGIEIPETYIESSDDDTITYKIPGLYTGDHICTVSMDGKYNKNYNIGAGRSDTDIIVKDIEVTNEQQTEVINEAYNAFRKIVEAEVRGDDFNVISGLFAPQAIVTEKAKYNEDKTYFLSTNKTSGISTVEIEDVTASIYDQAYTDDTLEVGVKLEYNNSNKGTVDPIIAYIFKKTEGEDTDNNVSQVIRMQYIDGKWLITSTGDNRIVENNWFML